MPRILPRLIQRIQDQAGQPKFFTFPERSKGPKSLYQPPLSAPSFQTADYGQSILLVPRSPVSNAKDYVRHKRLPPSLSRPRENARQIDSTRQMTDSEFGWWANPYVRMLTSPMRLCSVTNRVLPTDFLIRLVGLRLPPSQLSVSQKQKSVIVLAPDGLQHPKYTNRKAGTGTYVLCWREAVQQLRNSGIRRVEGNVTISPRLGDQIAHFLRLRVLQEFELLTERLEYAIRARKNIGDYGVTLTRLTREEWGRMRSTGTVPFKNAVAVLIVPPVNADTVTKERPRPSMAALPLNDEDKVDGLPPLSVLMPALPDSVDVLDVLPRLQIPLYNGVSAFPSRSQRSALHSFLLRILAAERFVKRLHSNRRPSKAISAPGKASHAFLLCSDKDTARRGDCAGIARALWRLRMYESEGWP